MSQYEHEGATSPGYPENESHITLDVTDYGLLEASFEFAVVEHGNDRTASWPSFTDEHEGFSVAYKGKGSTLAEGNYWGIWHVTFKGQSKTHRVDVGNNSVERLDSGTYVSATFRDVSDLIAAYFSLREYNYQQRLHGSLAARLHPHTIGSLLLGFEADPDDGRSES